MNLSSLKESLTPEPQSRFDNRVLQELAPLSEGGD
jgi:hypothetical protein